MSYLQKLLDKAVELRQTGQLWDKEGLAQMMTKVLDAAVLEKKLNNPTDNSDNQSGD